MNADTVLELLGRGDAVRALALLDDVRSPDETDTRALVARGMVLLAKRPPYGSAERAADRNSPRRHRSDDIVEPCPGRAEERRSGGRAVPDGRAGTSDPGLGRAAAADCRSFACDGPKC